jgi:hypothetical protein
LPKNVIAIILRSANDVNAIFFFIEYGCCHFIKSPDIEVVPSAINDVDFTFPLSNAALVE